ADAGSVHARVGDDQGRAEQPVDDPPGLRLRAGVQLLRHRLRIVDRHRHAAGGRRVRPRLRPSAAIGGAVMASRRGLDLTSKTDANVSLVVVGIIFLVPLLWLVLAAVSPNPSAQIAVPDEFS